MRRSLSFFLLEQAHIALPLHNKTLKTGCSFTTHWLALIAFHIISTPAESPAAPVHPGMQQYRKEGVLHLKSLLHAWVHSWPGYQKTVDYHFGSLKPTWHQTLSYAYLLWRRVPLSPLDSLQSPKLQWRPQLLRVFKQDPSFTTVLKLYESSNLLKSQNIFHTITTLILLLPPPLACVILSVNTLARKVLNELCMAVELNPLNLSWRWNLFSSATSFRLKV